METSTLIRPQTATRVGIEFAASEKDGRGPRRAAAAVVVLALVAGAAGAVVLRRPGRAEAAVLRYAFEPGRQRTYALTADVRFTPKGVPGAPEGPVGATISGTVSTTVVDVAPDGTATLEVRTSDLAVMGPPGAAQTGEAPPAQTVRMRIAPDGRVVAVEGDAGLFALPGSPAGSSLPGVGDANELFPQLPSGPVAPGDRWDKRVRVPLAPGRTVDVRTKGRHEGFSDTPFGRAARVEEEATLPLDLSIPVGELLGAFGGGTAAPAQLGDATFTMSGKITSVGTALVLPADGDLVQLDGDIRMDLRIGAKGVPTGRGPDSVALAGTVALHIVRTE